MGGPTDALIFGGRAQRLPGTRVSPALLLPSIISERINNLTLIFNLSIRKKNI